MLLPRMKLARLFDRAFHVMADLHWTLLLALIVAHAASTWAMMLLAGEDWLLRPATFFYWYATTAYTVGYGDLSPQSDAGRLITAVWVFPGAIAAFTTVVAKVLAAIGEIWRVRRSGKGDYSRMTASIVLIGYHPVRTAKMIDDRRSTANEGKAEACRGPTVGPLRGPTHRRFRWARRAWKNREFIGLSARGGPHFEAAGWAKFAKLGPIAGLNCWAKKKPPPCGGGTR